MKDGHPYLTMELDEQRIRQRKQLRAVPDWLLSKDRFGVTDGSVKVPDADRAYVEQLVRDEADRVAPYLEEFFKKEIEDTAVDRLAEFVMNQTSERPGENLESERSWLVDNLIDRRRRPVMPPLHGEARSHLARVILLLVWADELAGDYRDPRLPAAPAAS